jgi:hypothetical protein
MDHNSYSYEGIGGISPVGGSFGATPTFDYNPSFSLFSTEDKPATKPGFDWRTLLTGVSQASPSIERAIMRMRGFPESSVGYSSRSPRMAGSDLSAFLQSQAGQGSDSLAKILQEASTGLIGAMSDF